MDTTAFFKQTFSIDFKRLILSVWVYVCVDRDKNVQKRTLYLTT